MSIVFKAKYLNALRSKLKLDAGVGQDLYRKKWVVYAKRPFGKAKQVVEYLGRYTHKIAISNHRIIGIDTNSVTFSYKDYKTGGNKKSMTLSHSEFIRRFAVHILPKRFTRIRHFGILSSTWKRGKLKTLQAQLTGKEAIPIGATKKPRICPCCKAGHLQIILQFGARGPPANPESVLPDLLRTLLSA